jgi:CheY-like chemotaxis protein
VTRRILVIDDDAQIRAVASASLNLVGTWDVLTAASGAEGIALATEHRPDAILLDVMMPGMDGTATLRALRTAPETADLPVIMLTATVGADGGPPAFDHRVEAVIPKPFDIMGLADQVAAAMGWDI